jgi:hypothetical protein
MKRLLFAGLVAGAVFLGLRSTGEEPDGGPVKELMRLKLERAQTVLAAIVKGDFEAVESAAGRLSALSQAAAWRINDDKDYIRNTVAFRRSADDLAKAARARDIDAAAAAYVRMTRVCVQCHKVVRRKRMVSLEIGRASSAESLERGWSSRPGAPELAGSRLEITARPQD